VDDFADALANRIARSTVVINAVLVKVVIFV
jgi:hypothetical protein